MAMRLLQCRLRAVPFILTDLKPLPLCPISTSHPLSQESDVAVPNPDSSLTTPLPPSPSSGRPLYQENRRNLTPQQESLSLVPTGGFQTPYPISGERIFAYSQTLNAAGLMDVFSHWVTEFRWSDTKQLFEFWIRSLDGSGKPNRPDVGLYNQYLTANLMLGATAGELLDLVAQMDEYGMLPNTASYNIVLKAMCQAKETEAVEKLMDRMLQTESLPDEESYKMAIILLLSESRIEPALKYFDVMLKSGYVVSLKVFMDCVWCCLKAERLDTLASIIEKCKSNEHNRLLCPSWNLSKHVLEIALQEDHSKLALYSLEFLARWMRRDKETTPGIRSVDEGLILSALSVASRTHDTKLLGASWSVLEHSLDKRKVPNPHSFLGKIHALSSLGYIRDAFITLKDFESVHGDSPKAEELFSPFTSLYPLVVACCETGFSTLDKVYFQLENLSRSAEGPYKSVAALNCVILGSANIWDLERAYETFESIGKTFGLTPDIHSYNALMNAFGKHRKTDEASRVFEHLTSLGVKPNAITYSLLVDAHLVNRDHKSALDVIDEMVNTGFVPSKDTLRKVRRRCLRELDFDSNDKVDSLARKLNYRMGSDVRREQLFGLEYATEYA